MFVLRLNLGVCVKEGLAKVGRETAYRKLNLYAGLDTIGAISKDLKKGLKLHGRWLLD